MALGTRASGGSRLAMSSAMENSQLIGGSPLVHARVAGLVGLLVLASGSFAGIVASRLIVRDDVAATSRNILASESLYRLGIVGSLVMMIAWMFYALLLYRLLRPVHKWRAMTMVGLVLASRSCSRRPGSWRSR